MSGRKIKDDLLLVIRYPIFDSSRADCVALHGVSK